jgi:predicted heme/steroid binding protein
LSGPISKEVKVMKMKQSKNFLIVVAASVLLLWCVSASAQDVKYNFLAGTDFSKYKTYKWVRVPNVQYPNQILDGQIMQSIEAQLALKGLTKTEGESPDLYVCYQAAVSHEQQWNSYSTDMGGWGYGRWGGWGGMGGMSTTTTTSSTINIGTLNLDFYDVAAKNQVWRGAATKTLGSGKDPQKVQKNLDKATAKLLKNYPPPVKK